VTRPRLPAALRRYWPEAALLVFVLVCLATMPLVPSWEAVPFHLVYVSVTIVYGIRLWPLRGVIVAASSVTLVLGLATVAAVAAGREGAAELIEVPLMSLMFMATFWHVRTRQRAAAAIAELADDRAAMIERERALFANASHELLTPLTIARGHLEVLGRGNVPIAATVSETRDVVIEELHRMEHLVLDLLAIGRLEAAPVETAKVDVGTVLDAVGRRWSRVADRRWTVSVSAGSGWIDEVALVHALDCILSNAVKYSARGDAIAFEASVDERCLVIAVDDEGCGIPEADLPRVFERFYRASGRTRRLRGSGLGLAIASQVVQAHGGAIDASRGRSGRGTRITLRLPVMRVAPSAAGALLRLPMPSPG